MRTQAAEKGFWHNNVTGESSWESPPALGIPTADGKGKYWVVDGSPSWEPPSPFAWRAIPSTDPAQKGRPYFENWVTKEVTWERPAALGWSRRSVNDTWWWNVVTGETARAPPVDVVGIPTEDGEHTYFIDAKTGKATWDKPPAAAWVESKSAEHDRPFWFNSVTKESTWERPASSNVAWMKARPRRPIAWRPIASLTPHPPVPSQYHSEL